VEFEVSEEGREDDVLQHLLRRAVAETFRGRLGGVDLSALVARVEEGSPIEVGDLVTSDEVLRRVGPLDGLGRIVSALEGDDGAGESPGVAAACVETALEGLFLTRRISKDEVPGGGRAVYGGA
jgi:magnesium chelatase subunit I